MGLIKPVAKAKHLLGVLSKKLFVDEVPVTVKVKKSANTVKDRHYPSFSHELPYRYFDKEYNLFLNKKNAGILYQIIPLTGGNENVAEQLDSILRTKVSDEFTLQLILVKHNQVGYLIEEFATQFNARDYENLSLLGDRLQAFYKESAKKGFNTRTNESPRLTHTECFILVDKGFNGNEPEVKASFDSFRISFEAALSASKIGFKRGGAEEFLHLINFYLSHDPQSIYPKEVTYQEEQPLNYQTHGGSFNIEYRPDCALISNIDDKGKSYQTAVSTLTLDRLPEEFHLWDNINNTCNIFSKEQRIQCNHIISVIYKVEDQAKAISKTNRKTRDLDKKANSEYAVNVAGTEKKAQIHREFREDLVSNNTRSVKMLYNVMLFSRPEDKERDVESAIHVFSCNKLGLALIKGMQPSYFLVSMPFLYTNNLSYDYSLPRMMHQFTSWNATQYMPLLSDWSGLSSGVLMPTLRDQFSLIDPFDSRLGTNFNMAITGTSGGGKSFAIQMMLLNVIFGGGSVFIIDIGGSYKKLCNVLGGTYLEYNNLAMNPFTHVDNLFKEIDSIVDLFELLSCSRKKATDDDRGSLREAIVVAFDTYGPTTKIDDVAKALISLFENEPETYPTAKILAKNLKPYCSDSEHGRVFNQPSKFSPGAKIVVVDLEDIKDKDSIQAPVLLSVISQIRQRMYSTDRSIKKMCIIDEAWKFFTGDEIATKFIEQGFRTGRRHNASFVTITQGVGDYYAFSEARAAWDNSSLKLVFLQDQAALLEHAQKHDTFTEYEIELLKKFPKAKDAGYSQVLLKSGGISSFHRLFVCPFTRVLLSSDGSDYTRVQNHVDLGMSFLDAVKKVTAEIEGENHVA